MQAVAKRMFTFTICVVAALLIACLVANPGQASAKAPVLAKKTMTVMVGGSAKVKVKNTASKSKLAFTSKNKKVATVSKKGKVVGKKAGTAKIVVTVKRGASKKKLTCTVKVKQAVVAVIDSGAKKGQKVCKALTVIGGSPYGTYSHGHNMVANVIKEAPGAKVISIKASKKNAFWGSDLAEAVHVAIDNKATIISMSFVGPCNPEGDFYLSVKEALAKGIKVVVAAGNNGGKAKDYQGLASLKKVIVVGASDGKKVLKKSNTGADVYIKAGATSGAASRYAGMLANGRVYDAIYK